MNHSRTVGAGNLREVSPAIWIIDDDSFRDFDMVAKHKGIHLDFPRKDIFSSVE